MGKKNKYRVGATIHTISNFDAWVSDHRWIYLHQKVMHPSFITSMPYRTVRNFLKTGSIKGQALHIRGFTGWMVQTLSQKMQYPSDPCFRTSFRPDF